MMRRMRVLERLEELYAIGGGPGANRVGDSAGEQRAPDLATATAPSVPHAADVNDQIEFSYPPASPPTNGSLLNLRSTPVPGRGSGGHGSSASLGRGFG